MLQQERSVKTIYTYIGIDEDGCGAYFIYDPETDKHYPVSKEKYEEVMKNVKST